MEISNCASSGQQRSIDYPPEPCVDEFATEYNESCKDTYENELRNYVPIANVSSDFGRDGYLFYENKKDTTNYNALHYARVRPQTLKRTMPYFDRAKTTKRELRSIEKKGNPGVSSLNVGGYTTSNIKARTTKKQITRVKDYIGQGNAPFTASQNHSKYTEGLTKVGTKPHMSYIPGAQYQFAQAAGKERFCIKNISKLSEQPTSYSRAIYNRVNTSIPCKDSIGEVRMSRTADIHEDDSRFMPEIANQLAGNPFVPGAAKQVTNWTDWQKTYQFNNCGGSGAFKC